ncbi:MAG: sodium:proton antiporter [Verrucomicrobiae bacterium]|nr:sodium:proton antiporter [Verrucomicrobiae bacterium]
MPGVYHDPGRLRVRHRQIASAPVRLDYIVAGTAAAFPWVFCAAYFVWALDVPSWKEALLLGRFASPTSAGVLFSMLAAAGLSATWLFRKARVLAIFDDLDTILFMIPLKMMMVGFRWQLAVAVFVIVVSLWLAWRHLHALRLPVNWQWMLVYAGVITCVCEAIYLWSTLIDDTVPVHLEVLLPAFVLGCMLERRPAHGRHGHDGHEAHESPAERRAATIVSACFMVLVGLSMPPVPRAEIDWGTVAAHVVVVTALSNLGKMFPALCYRREASFRERLAVAISLFPRGEVGAGVLVVSLSYGLSGAALAVAVLSLALNLLLTGLFIAVVKHLISRSGAGPAPGAA